jgi:hypothetical protein
LPIICFRVQSRGPFAFTYSTAMGLVSSSSLHDRLCS